MNLVNIYLILIDTSLCTKGKKGKYIFYIEDM